MLDPMGPFLFRLGVLYSLRVRHQMRLFLLDLMLSFVVLSTLIAIVLGFSK
jgi:hypothetical protein